MHRLRKLVAKLPKKDSELIVRRRRSNWAAASTMPR